ncbi:MAG: hypothetical protein ACPLRM_00905, partial [Anaerolineae bacterium]
FRKLIRRVPGVLWCYNLARDIGLLSSGGFPPWERFGQGHTLLAILEKIPSDLCRWSLGRLG